MPYEVASVFEILVHKPKECGITGKHALGNVPIGRNAGWYIRILVSEIAL